MNKIIKFIIVFILIGIFSNKFSNIAQSTLIDNELFQISSKVDYYSNYWINYYKLFRYYDINGKKITVKSIRNIIYRLVWQESKFVIKSRS